MKYGNNKVTRLRLDLDLSLDMCHISLRPTSEGSVAVFLASYLPAPWSPREEVASMETNTDHVVFEP